MRQLAGLWLQDSLSQQAQMKLQAAGDPGIAFEMNYVSCPWNLGMSEALMSRSTLLWLCLGA